MGCVAPFHLRRIALGRTGGSPRTATVLDFRLAHAQTRDAVYVPFDAPRLVSELETALVQDGVAAAFSVPACCLLATAVADRVTYLARPDFGRRLVDASRDDLRGLASEWGRRDLAIIVSDGLSAEAAHRHATATITCLAVRLAAAGWTFFPVFVVPFGRVKLQDEIGEIVGARHSLMLLGERPGLDSPDSLGATSRTIPVRPAATPTAIASPTSAPMAYRPRTPPPSSPTYWSFPPASAPAASRSRTPAPPAGWPIPESLADNWGHRQLPMGCGLYRWRYV